MISYFVRGYAIKIDFFSRKKKTEDYLCMSNSIDSSIHFDWPIFVLIGFVVFGAVFIMLKLTVGSCYKPPPEFNRHQDKKVM